MRAKPSGQRLGFPILEQIDRSMRLEADQDGRIDVPEADDEIIDAEDLRC